MSTLTHFLVCIDDIIYALSLLINTFSLSDVDRELDEESKQGTRCYYKRLYSIFFFKKRHEDYCGEID